MFSVTWLTLFKIRTCENLELQFPWIFLPLGYTVQGERHWLSPLKIYTWGFSNTLTNPNLQSDMLSDNSRHTRLKFEIKTSACINVGIHFLLSIWLLGMTIQTSATATGTLTLEQCPIASPQFVVPWDGNALSLMVATLKLYSFHIHIFFRGEITPASI